LTEGGAGAKAPAPMLETARLRLRPLTEADVTDAYVGWLNDPEVVRYLETRHAPQTRESVRAFVDAVNGRENEHLFGIFERVDARHIGNIKVGPVHPIHAVADVSLLIGARDVWGRG
jgi:[ribosomal protein S5]-alanine N-acetyltransferase